MPDEATWSLINTATVATLAVIACVALWRYVTGLINAQIEDLKKQRDLAHDMRRSEIADLRARVMVIEDNLHISRNERFEYLPANAMPPGKSEMKDFD